MALSILISNNAESLAAALVAHETFAVVEAEYGAYEVVGSTDLLTLNHHVRTERPCPCSLTNERFDAVRDEIEAVGISHFDLDTLGGIMAIMGLKREYAIPGFWELAEWVDTKGPHRMRECPDYNIVAATQIASFWAWQQANPLRPAQDGSVTECGMFVRDAIRELHRILCGNLNALERGSDFLMKEAGLKADSYVRCGVSATGLRIVLRDSEAFTNHLYYMLDGSPADVVIGYDRRAQCVLVSRADDTVPVNAREIVQQLWGKEAGGHVGIAGSPRGIPLDPIAAERAYEMLLRQ